MIVASLRLIRLLPLVLVKDNLAHPHALGSDLDVLVLLDVLQRLLKREDDGRDDPRLVVRT